MGLIDQAKADIEDITSNDEDWAVPISFIAPGSTFDGTFDETFQNGQAAIYGIHTKIHKGFDVNSGQEVNVKNARIGFSEKFLTDTGYPVRNAAGMVNLKGHRVAVKDSTGNVSQYVIKEFFPDETIGYITCVLGDYKV